MTGIKNFKIHNVTCRTNYPASSMTDYFRILKLDRTNLQEHIGIKRVCEKFKEILQNKLHYIAKAIDEYDLNIAIVLGFSFNNDEQDTIDFELVVSDLQGRVLGGIIESSFGSNKLEFTITLKQLMEYEDMPLYNILSSIPKEEWYLYCTFFERDKSLDTIKKIESQVHMSDLYQPSDHMVAKIKNNFKVDSKIKDFLYGVQNDNLYDFSNINYYESIYLFGFNNKFALCIKNKPVGHIGTVRSNNTCSKDLEHLSNYTNIKEIENDFKKFIIKCLVELKILNKELLNHYEVMTIKEIFELSKLLSY